MHTNAHAKFGWLAGTLAAAGLLIAAAAATHAQSAPADNTLTAQEKAEGWKLLFDGKTTDGWRGYQKKDVPAGWKAVDGELARVGEGGDLVSIDEYTDFDLKIDWKIAPNGNSGIFYRGSESEERMYYSAPEYQVLDNDGHPDAKNGPDRFAGANYALMAPSKQVCHPAGQWNSTRIVVRGAHVEHWLNGEKVVDYELWSPEWKKLVAASKFKAWPTYGMAKTGRIGLQDHGNAVAFKNIKIKVLK
jgi:3-keto-disaccharide hydrolase